MLQYPRDYYPRDYHVSMIRLTYYTHSDGRRRNEYVGQSIFRWTRDASTANFVRQTLPQNWQYLVFSPVGPGSLEILQSLMVLRPPPIVPTLGHYTGPWQFPLTLIARDYSVGPKLQTKLFFPPFFSSWVKILPGIYIFFFDSTTRNDFTIIMVRLIFESGWNSFEKNATVWENLITVVIEFLKKLYILDQDFFLSFSWVFHPKKLRRICIPTVKIKKTDTERMLRREWTGH